jgi:hypothetical protein
MIRPPEDPTTWSMRPSSSLRQELSSVISTMSRGKQMPSVTTRLFRLFHRRRLMSNGIQRADVVRISAARDSGAKIFEIRHGELTFPRLGRLWAPR